MTTLETAFYWTASGISVIPLWHRTKIPAVDWLQFQVRLPTNTELAAWFGRRPMNLGVVCGSLIVLDIDSMDAYNVWLAWCKHEYPEVAQTYQVKSARGVHVYVRLPQPVRGQKIPGFGEVKGLGGYVVAPPSIHPGGTQYVCVEAGPVIECERIPLPPQILSSPSSDRVVRPVITGNDPWQTRDAVDRARQHRIEDYFPAALKSGNGFLRDWCPFHPDREHHNTRSFWINTEKQICGCHVCGGKVMDVINVVAKIREITNSEAIKELARTA